MLFVIFLCIGAVILGILVTRKRNGAKPSGKHPPAAQGSTTNLAAQTADVHQDTRGNESESQHYDPGGSGYDGGRTRPQTTRDDPRTTRPQSTKKLIFGEVRYFNVREEEKGGIVSPNRKVQVWTFRVYADTKDRYGNDVYLIEMRGRNFVGALTNGDQVGFFRSKIRKDNRPIELSKIANISAGGSIVSAV